MSPRNPALQTPETEAVVLVLQGGGALGAYQAGAAVALAAAGHAPDWVAGISIGAINGAIIAGNPVDRREAALRDFWEGCGRVFPYATPPGGAWADWAAGVAMVRGVPGFFAPRVPPAPYRVRGTDAAISHYDTAPLRATLERLVDFDWLNDRGPRLSLGAVDVETGNFVYFDSRDMRIGPEHVMASGALPPAFAPVRIGGRAYWDGGLVSNTPLGHVLDTAGADALCIVQVDLFSARGAVPGDLPDVAGREKDIRYSSRTRLTTDLFRERHARAAAARRLRDRLPAELRGDPDLSALCEAAPAARVALLHLIHRKDTFEGGAKDYEFSRAAVDRHWAEGARDAAKAVGHRDWKNRPRDRDGLTVFDFGRAERSDTPLTRAAE